MMAKSKPIFRPLLYGLMLLLLFSTLMLAKDSNTAAQANTNDFKVWVLSTQPAGITNRGQSDSYAVGWQVLSGGTARGNSSSFELNVTVGQTSTGAGKSESFEASTGFWQQEPDLFCDCQPGEVDAIPPINILDIVYLINYKYKNGPTPIPYEFCNGDPNHDCAVNILDIVYLINYKYKNGPEPATCEEWTAECGSLRK